MPPVGPGTMLGGRYALRTRVVKTSRIERWEAHDTTLGREVLVTTIAANDPVAVDALDAARRASAVSDPRLVRVLDAATQDSATYIVEEADSSATTLEELLSAGPLSSREARRIAAEVADVLSRVQNRGLHHQLLSPSVVQRARSGQVRIRGLAVDAALAGLDDTNGAKASRADVVGAVSVLYAALTATWPWSNPSSALTGTPRVGGRVVPAGDLVAAVPGDLSDLVDRTLGQGRGPAAPEDLAAVLRPEVPVSAPGPARQPVLPADLALPTSGAPDDAASAEAARSDETAEPDVDATVEAAATPTGEGTAQADEGGAAQARDAASRTAAAGRLADGQDEGANGPQDAGQPRWRRLLSRATGAAGVAGVGAAGAASAAGGAAAGGIAGGATGGMPGSSAAAAGPGADAAAGAASGVGVTGDGASAAGSTTSGVRDDEMAGGGATDDATWRGVATTQTTAPDGATSSAADSDAAGSQTAAAAAATAGGATGLEATGFDTTGLDARRDDASRSEATGVDGEGLATTGHDGTGDDGTGDDVTDDESADDAREHDAARSGRSGATAAGAAAGAAAAAAGAKGLLAKARTYLTSADPLYSTGNTGVMPAVRDDVPAPTDPSTTTDETALAQQSGTSDGLPDEDAGSRDAAASPAESLQAAPEAEAGSTTDGPESERAIPPADETIASAAESTGEQAVDQSTGPAPGEPQRAADLVDDAQTAAANPTDSAAAAAGEDATALDRAEPTTAPASVFLPAAAGAVWAHRPTAPESEPANLSGAESSPTTASDAAQPSPSTDAPAATISSSATATAPDTDSGAEDEPRSAAAESTDSETHAVDSGRSTSVAAQADSTINDESSTAAEESARGQDAADGIREGSDDDATGEPDAELSSMQAAGAPAGAASTQPGYEVPQDLRGDIYHPPSKAAVVAGAAIGAAAAGTRAAAHTTRDAAVRIGKAGVERAETWKRESDERKAEILASQTTFSEVEKSAAVDEEPIVPILAPDLPAATPSRQQAKFVVGLLAGFLVLALVAGILGIMAMINNLNDKVAAPPVAETITVTAPAVTVTATPSSSATGSGSASASPSTTASATPSATGSGTPVTFSSASGFDPQGNKEENDARAGRAIDGNPQTAWTSKVYKNATGWDGVKTGVGLILALPKATTLNQITVDVGTPVTPGDVTIYTATTPALDGATSVLQQTGASGTLTETVAPGTAPASYVIVWFTKPGDYNGRYVASVAEVTAN